MSDISIEQAGRKARVRAIVMCAAAAVLLLNAALQYGSPAYSSSGVRGASWPITIVLWLIILANGGGIRLRGRMRSVINDELSVLNRSRAIVAGFYATVAAALALYMISLSVEISTPDALRVVSAIGVATALARFAWLDWQ